MANIEEFVTKSGRKATRFSSIGSVRRKVGQKAGVSKGNEVEVEVGEVSEKNGAKRETGNVGRNEEVDVKVRKIVKSDVILNFGEVGGKRRTRSMKFDEVVGGKEILKKLGELTKKVFGKHEEKSAIVGGDLKKFGGKASRRKVVVEEVGRRGRRRTRGRKIAEENGNLVKLGEEVKKISGENEEKTKVNEENHEEVDETSKVNEEISTVEVEENGGKVENVVKRITRRRKIEVQNVEEKGNLRKLGKEVKKISEKNKEKSEVNEEKHNEVDETLKENEEVSTVEVEENGGKVENVVKRITRRMKIDVKNVEEKGKLGKLGDGVKKISGKNEENHNEVAETSKKNEEISTVEVEENGGKAENVEKRITRGRKIAENGRKSTRNGIGMKKMDVENVIGKRTRRKCEEIKKNNEEKVKKNVVKSKEIEGKLKKNEVKPKKNEVKLKENEVKLKKNGGKLKENEVKLKENEVKLKENEVKLKKNGVKLKENEVKLKENEEKPKKSEVKLKENEVKLKKNGVKLKENEVKLKENEVKPKKSEVKLIKPEVAPTNPRQQPSRRRKPQLNYRISDLRPSTANPSNVSHRIPIYKQDVAVVRDHKQNDIFEFDFHEEKRILKKLHEDSDIGLGFDRDINEDMESIKRLEKKKQKIKDRKISPQRNRKLPKMVQKSPTKARKVKTQKGQVLRAEDPTQKLKDLMTRIKDRQRENAEKRLSRSLELSEGGVCGDAAKVGGVSDNRVGGVTGNGNNVGGVWENVGVSDGAKRIELEDGELEMGPAEEPNADDFFEENGAPSPGIEEDFGFDQPNAVPEFKIPPRGAKRLARRPDANSTMIASPWRPHLVSRCGPRFLTTKRSSNLPTYDQDLVINSTILEGSFMGSPRRPKTLKQSSILDFVGGESPRQRPQNCSLFDADQLSPIKKLADEPKPRAPNQHVPTKRPEFTSPEPHNAPRNLPPSPKKSPLRPRHDPNLPPSRTSLSPRKPSTSPHKPHRTSDKENYLTPLRSEDDVLFGFDDSFEPHVRQAVPTRLSLREVKKIVQEDTALENAAEATSEVRELQSEIQSEVQSEVFMSPKSQLDVGDVPIVGLFEDFEVKVPAKSTYERRGRKRFPEYTILEEESDEELRLVKKPKKKKKEGFTRQERIEEKKWIEKFNSMCEEVDKHKLEIE